MECSVPFGEDAEIETRFREDGFVVVRNVVSDDEIACAMKELWENPRLLGRSSLIQREDPRTWTGDWPQSDGGKNFLESLDAYQDQACWNFFQHQNVVHLNRLLHGRSVYVRGAPRWGVMRPTAVNPAWRTDESWLHWDQNPWAEPDFCRVQCFLCLTDQTPTSGGFLCAPGLHKRWRQWGIDNTEGTLWSGQTLITRDFGDGNPFPVPESDNAHAEIVRVLAPAGSLVLWDGRLPHQNYPNTGTDFRVVMYLNFFAFGEEAFEKRKHAVRRKIVVMRALGQECTGVFPTKLTPLGREVTCAPDAAEEIAGNNDSWEDPLLYEAIKLAHEAGLEEYEGNYTSSIEKHRQAMKRWPDIERDWYDVIFA